MIKRSLLIWLSVIPLAVLNGVLRDYVVAPLTGIKYAMPLSGILLCVFIFIVSIIFIPRLGRGTKYVYLKMGLVWMAATVIFEFILGFAMGEKLPELIKVYDITTGNLWSIVILFIGFTPLLVAGIKRLV